MSLELPARASFATPAAGVGDAGVGEAAVVGAGAAAAAGSVAAEASSLTGELALPPQPHTANPKNAANKIPYLVVMFTP